MSVKSPTGAAAGLGFVALVLLAGGSANAQTACFGTGWEAVSRAVEAIEAVTLRIVRIEAENDNGNEKFTVSFSIDNEHSCLADNRTRACVQVTPDGRGTSEHCGGIRLQASFLGGNRMHFGGLPNRARGMETMTAQIRVRYYGAGGAWTLWSPEFNDTVALGVHWNPEALRGR